MAQEPSPDGIISSHLNFDPAGNSDPDGRNVLGYVEIYTRADDRIGWRRVINGDIVATDGGQGYENYADCQVMAVKLNPGIEIRDMTHAVE